MKSTLITLAAATAAGTAYAQSSAYGQCGGQGWSGSTTCVSGFTCQRQSEYYSQCLPGTATTTRASTTTSRTGGSTPTPTSGGSSGSGRVSYAGTNIAGLDFGCTIDGTCKTTGVVDPGQTGLNQMKHFVNDDGLNTFRVPVGWQFLLNNNLGGTLDSNNWQTYDRQIQGCLNTGAALCIVDIHNYARWNGAIVGQGGPTNAQFASLWSQIAAKYKGNNKIAFGLMNEPHDLNINTWATTVQAVVTAIRQAGATGNKILLPGTDFTSAGAFISNGSGGALIKVTNLDGSTTNLIFDVHKYLDSDNSGTHTTCTTNNADAFTNLGNWLRQNKRQAILTETGGGATDSSCLKAVCEQLDVLNNYSDVYLGWTGWSAGIFSSSYELTEVPTQNGNSWTDVPLVTQCIAGKFKR